MKDSRFFRFPPDTSYIGDESPRNRRSGGTRRRFSQDGGGKNPHRPITRHLFIPHLSSLIVPHPSSFIPNPSSLILHRFFPSLALHFHNALQVAVAIRFVKPATLHGRNDPQKPDFLQNAA